MKRRYTFFLLSFVFLLSACTVAPKPPEKREILKLAKEISQQSPKISKQSAMIMSADIYSEVNQLTKKFSLTSPPWWHNFLVNVGVKKKGLCYHWADALYVYLMQKEYPGIEFHLVGANISEYFFEHNAVVLVGEEGNISNGIVLDPWRDSGELFYSIMKRDQKYDWKHRPERGCRRNF